MSVLKEKFKDLFTKIGDYIQTKIGTHKLENIQV